MVEKICNFCGNKYNVESWRFITSKFCSHKCHSNSMLGIPKELSIAWRGGKINKVCEFCKKEYEAWPYLKNKKFCSLACYNKHKKTPIYRKIYMGKNNVRYKGKLKKICLYCKKEYEVLPCRELITKFCSRNCRGKHYAGSLGHNWKGGITEAVKHRYRNENWKKIIMKVYKRDKWTCQRCGIHIKKHIQCHHIVPYRISNDNSLKNLITLCKKCHPMVEKLGQQYFKFSILPKEI